MDCSQSLALRGGLGGSLVSRVSKGSNGNDNGADQRNNRTTGQDAQDIDQYYVGEAIVDKAAETELGVPAHAGGEDEPATRL